MPPIRPVLPTIQPTAELEATSMQLLLHLLVTLTLLGFLYASIGSIWAFVWASALVLSASASWTTFRLLLRQELEKSRLSDKKRE